MLWLAIRLIIIYKIQNIKYISSERIDKIHKF